MTLKILSLVALWGVAVAADVDQALFQSLRHNRQDMNACVQSNGEIVLGGTTEANLWTETSNTVEKESIEDTQKKCAKAIHYNVLHVDYSLLQAASYRVHVHQTEIYHLEAEWKIVGKEEVCTRLDLLWSVQSKAPIDLEKDIWQAAQKWTQENERRLTQLVRARSAESVTRPTSAGPTTS